MTSFPKEKIKIVLLEDIHSDAVAVFQEAGYKNIVHHKTALSEEALVKALKGTHILGIRSKSQITEHFLKHADKLLTIGCFCIGTNQVDLRAAGAVGISVFNSPYSNTRSVAELVIGEAILLMRQIIIKNDALHKGVWEKTASSATEIRGKTIGIVGYGHIGSQVSVLAENMGMRVLYYDIENKLPLGNAQPVRTLNELLAKSDVITFHVPETKATHHLLNAKNIQHISESAVVLNLSRGNVVDLDVLQKAVAQKKIKGVAIDVYPHEPLSNHDSFHSPLQNMPNVILTPHIGGSTVEAQARIGSEVALKLVSFLESGNTTGSHSLPELSLPQQENRHRILHIHRNKPGVLSKITTILSENKINISAQYLQTKNEIGYAVFDVDKKTSQQAIKKLEEIDETIKSRILY